MTKHDEVEEERLPLCRRKLFILIDVIFLLAGTDREADGPERHVEIFRNNFSM